TSRPIALAVLRLITNSNLLGVCTGRSAFTGVGVRGPYITGRRRHRCARCFDGGIENHKVGPARLPRRATTTWPTCDTALEIWWHAKTRPYCCPIPWWSVTCWASSRHQLEKSTDETDLANLKKAGGRGFCPARLTDPLVQTPLGDSEWEVSN